MSGRGVAQADVERERGLTLVLVRHGQATASAVTTGQGDYDQLSALGETQSRLLGPWLGAHLPAATRVLVGPRKRHAQTHAAMRSALPEQARWAEAEPCAALDEHHGVQLVSLLAPELAARQDALGAAVRAMLEGGPDRLRHTGQMFRLALAGWARGELRHPDVEDYADFRARLRGLYEELRSGDEGTIVAVSSAGAISALVADVLGLEGERALDLMWPLRNASVTTVRLRGGSAVVRPILHAYNEVAHLPDRDLWTHL